METLKITDTQAMEICESVGRTLVAQLDTDEVWDKVEQTLAKYLKTHNINENPSSLTDKLEWSVKVKLRK